MTRDELLAAGKRAAYKNQCDSVIVAPDHTGADNYHNCIDSPKHTGNHFTASDYVWNDAGVILRKPRPDRTDYESTRQVALWIANDGEHYETARAVLTQLGIDALASHLNLTLRRAHSQSAAWHTRRAISDNGMEAIDWNVVADEIDIDK